MVLPHHLTSPLFTVRALSVVNNFADGVVCCWLVSSVVVRLDGLVSLRPSNCCPPASSSSHLS